MKRYLWLVLIPVVLLAVWMGVDFARGARYSLRSFDGHAVGRLETAMWRSYYDHKPLSLYAELIKLLREQYRMPFWRASIGAYHAARAAVLFQGGHNRGEYERALPDLISFYGMIRQGSDAAFDVDKSARLELEWWIIHRERAQHVPGDLEQALADLQAEIYQRPSRVFAEHAKLRAQAMLMRDSVAEPDWGRIGALLDSSWVLLQAAVSQ